MASNRIAVASWRCDVTLRGTMRNASGGIRSLHYLHGVHIAGWEGALCSLACPESQPVYVTSIVGAPHPLVEAIFEYDPECEAIVVTEDEGDDDAIIVNRVRIQSRH